MRKKQVCAMFLSTSLTIMHVCACPMTILANECYDVTSFEELQNAIMEANNGDIIRIVTREPLEISDTIDIDKELTITGGTLTRAEDKTIFNVTGDLTLESIKLQGTREEKTWTHSPVICEGNLTLEDNVTITNFIARRGGGLYVAGGGDVVLNQGSRIINNEVHAIDRYNISDSAVGGGIFIDSGGSVELEGGIIDGNKATVENAYDQVAIGGGVAIKEGGRFVMNGGYITNNSVSGYYGTAEGGGIAAGSDHYYPSFEGLGTVSSDDLQLNAGTIASNSAVRGGGIYYHSGDTLYLADAAITDNEARFGGGIWYCQVGYGQLGTSLHLGGNRASRYGDDLYSANPFGMFDGYDCAFEMSLPDTTTWYDDYTNNKIEDINRYLYGYAMIWYWGVADENFTTWLDENSDLNFPLDREWEDLALKAENGVDSWSHALQIKNNVASQEGGGIACNGRLEAPDKEVPPPPPPPATPSEPEKETEPDIPVSTPSEPERETSTEETTAPSTEETTEEETTPPTETSSEEYTEPSIEKETTPAETVPEEPETPPDETTPEPVTPTEPQPAPPIEYFPDEQVPLGSFEAFEDEEVPLAPWEAPRTSDTNKAAQAGFIALLALASMTLFGHEIRKHKDD